MATELRFAVLGSVRCWRDGQETATGSPQQQALLVAFLLRKGSMIATSDLIGLVWGGQPPATAVGTVRTYISRLRRLLKGTDARIDALTGGYALRGEELSVDLWDLQAAMSSEPQAVEVLAEVLTAWSGAAIEGVPGEWAEAQRVRLDGLRVAAAEALVTARLREGTLSTQEFDVLADLVERHPLNEGTRALLMLAHHRAGRRAEALGVFQAGLHLLREELGVSPGPALLEAQQQILQEDHAPELLSTTYLPVALTDFVGRNTELAALEAGLTAPGSVVGIAGMGGSGRTALAVLAAHRLAANFPEGQVFCDLAETGGIGSAMEQLLRLLGNSTAGGLQDRAAALSALASQRRLLLVLDNVSDVGEIQVLRRALPKASLMFTSLRQFHATADVTWLRLRPLSTRESLALFSAVAGPDRVAGDPQGAAGLVALSGGYASAVRVFAQRVRDLENWSVTAITRNMKHEMAQVYASGHEDCAMLAAPVERTLDALLPSAVRVLRILGVLPEEDVSAGRLGELLGLPEQQIFFALAAGADVSLLDEGVSRDSDRMSDPVVRTVMMRLAYAVEGPQEVARLQAAQQDQSAQLCA